LIVPNDHVESVYDLRPEQAAAIFQASVSICRAIRDASNCAGIHQIGNNGRAAGQTVFHFHLHLMPRFTGDLAKMALYLFGRKSIKTDVVLDQMANDLRAKLTR